MGGKMQNAGLVRRRRRFANERFFEMDSITEIGGYESVWANLDRLSTNHAPMDENNPYNPILIIDWHLLEGYIYPKDEGAREWWIGFLADAARRMGGELRDFERWQSQDLLLAALTAYRFNRRYGEYTKLVAVPKMPAARRGLKAKPIEEKLEFAQLRRDNLDKPLDVVARAFGISRRTAQRWLKEIGLEL